MFYVESRLRLLMSHQATRDQREWEKAGPDAGELDNSLDIVYHSADSTSGEGCSLMVGTG